MKRLLEHSDSSRPVERRLVELIRAAEPHRQNPFQKRRILVSILKKRPPAQRRTSLMVRVATTALVLLGTTGVAAAALGGGSWLVSADSELGPRTTTVKLEPIVERSSARVRRATLAPAPLQEPERRVDEAPEVEPQPAAPEQPARPEVGLRNRSKPPPSAEPRLKPRGAAEDPTKVVEAIRALRSERDPARAEALLSQHLERYPDGALSEDALALSIEAAAARKDPRAVQYARRYLARYPEGRFRKLAERVLESKSGR